MRALRNFSHLEMRCANSCRVTPRLLDIFESSETTVRAISRYYGVRHDSETETGRFRRLSSMLAEFSTAAGFLDRFRRDCKRRDGTQARAHAFRTTNLNSSKLIWQLDLHRCVVIGVLTAGTMDVCLMKKTVGKL